jgi:hypothetical protein
MESQEDQRDGPTYTPLVSPALPPDELPIEMLGASVRRGDAPMPDSVPADAFERSTDRVRVVASRDVAHIAITGSGRVRVDGAGRSVTVELDEGADLGDVNAWLYGTAASMVLAQQGRFSLHASAVSIGGAVVAVAGPSNAGKSTTSMGLVNRGARLVADDVVILNVDSADAIVEPFGRPVHLWPETATALGVDVTDATRISSNTEKLLLAAPDASPVPLDSVVVLRRVEAASGVRSVPLVGPEAVRALSRNAYRRLLLADLWHDELFAWCSAVADRVAVHRVVRPDDGWTVDAVLDEVEAIAAGVAPRAASARSDR